MKRTAATDVVDEVRLAREWLESLEPEELELRDGQHLREVMAARQALVQAESRLRTAVTVARRAGDSWTAIGLALGTTKQNAHRKFGTRAS